MSSTPTYTPPSTPNINPLITETINESWCELNIKSGCSSGNSLHLNHSVNPEILEKLLQEAQKETNYPSTSISVQSSPKSPQTPIRQEHFESSSSKYHHININNSNNNNINKTTLNVNNLINEQQLNNSNNDFVNNVNIDSSGELNIDDIMQSSSLSIKRDTDWMWNWGSRPQTHPPKEWNFVHPNSSNIRYSIRNHELMDSKFFTPDTLTKLFFTHTTCFILGAAIMFFIMRRQIKISNCSS